MSRDEWERGEVKIPAAEWSVFRHALSSAFTGVLAKRYEMALELFNHLKTAGKGKRNFDFSQEARRWADGQQPTRAAYRWAGMNVGRCANLEDRELTAYDMIHIVLPHVTEGQRKPKMPKKKDFKAPRNVLDFDHPTLFWEAGLVLDPKTRTVHWNVPENNRAVEQAWDHPMGVAFARALQRVKWCRGSGGTFVGNDENNCDDTDEGGGANYVTRRFGPLGGDR